MQFFTVVSIMTGLAAAAPASEALIARAANPALLNLGIGGSSSPLLNVGLGGNTLLAVGVGGSSGSKTSSVVAVPFSTKAASITVPPASPATYPTEFPSTFSAPVQGVGKLTLDNLPALPGVLDKTFSGVLGAVYGLVSGLCNLDFMCTITVAGSIESLLVDGADYTAATTIQAWCDKGKCYGSANPTLTATAPFTITCDRLTGSNACSATIAGAVNAIFTNGKQVEAWGWVTPAGYCQNGVCVASVSAFGDPMY